MASDKRRITSVSIINEVDVVSCRQSAKQIAAWLGLDPDFALAQRDAFQVPRGYRVLVIGAGVAGLCAAIRLQGAGIPYVVIEKNAEVGGTWYENR